MYYKIMLSSTVQVTLKESCQLTIRPSMVGGPLKFMAGYVESVSLNMQCYDSEHPYAIWAIMVTLFQGEIYEHQFKTENHCEYTLHLKST